MTKAATAVTACLTPDSPTALTGCLAPIDKAGLDDLIAKGKADPTVIRPTAKLSCSERL